MLQSPGHFLILNGVIVTLLVLYFLFIKKGSASPTRLNLKKKDSRRNVEGLVVPGEVSSTGSSEYVPLNVIFNYNGHSFDAYEALGVPAGSDMEEVKKAFSDSCAKADPPTREFYKAAYEAIVTSR